MKTIFLLIAVLMAMPVSAAINESQFNGLIDRVTGHYRNHFSKKFPLIVLKNWNSPEANAEASNRAGESPSVVFYGGFAKRKALTPDAFALMVCHELGHLIGGAPQLRATPSEFFRPMSAEGQSDYFSAFCFRDVFKKDPVVKVLAPSIVEKECRLQWKNENDTRMCIRIAVAGLYFINTTNEYEIANRRIKLDFENPDPTVAQQSFGRNHPDAQCRLDTIYQAALCVPRSDEKISFVSESDYFCDSRRGDTLGTRPLCWFKPKN